MMMGYVQGLVTLVQLLWSLFPVVVSIARYIHQEQEKDLRKKLTQDIIASAQEASKTGDTSNLERIFKGKNAQAPIPSQPQS